MDSLILYCCHCSTPISSSPSILEKVLPNFIGALLSGLVAIWIFYEGQRRQKIKDGIKERNRLSELEGRINHIIFSLLEPIQKQINTYGSFVKELRKPQRKLISFSRNALLSSLVDSFYEESHSDLYNIYISSKSGSLLDKSAKLNLLNKNFYVLKFILTTIEGNYRELAGSLNALIKELEETRLSIEIFLQKNVSNNMANNKAPKDDPLIASLESIYLKFDSSDNNTYLSKKNFFLPIELLCRQFAHDPRAIELSIKAMKGLRAEYAIRNKRHELCAFFIEHIRALKRVKAEFEKLLVERV